MVTAFKPITPAEDNAIIMLHNEGYGCDTICKVIGREFYRVRDVAGHLENRLPYSPFLKSFFADLVGFVRENNTGRRSDLPRHQRVSLNELNKCVGNPGDVTAWISGLGSPTSDELLAIRKWIDSKEQMLLNDPPRPFIKKDVRSTKEYYLKERGAFSWAMRLADARIRARLKGYKRTAAEKIRDNANSRRRYHSNLDESRSYVRRKSAELRRTEKRIEYMNEWRNSRREHIRAYNASRLEAKREWRRKRNAGKRAIAELIPESERKRLKFLRDSHAQKAKWAMKWLMALEHTAG